jgi:hypothetical protein
MGIHDERRRRRAEWYGLSEPAPEAPTMSNTKAELLAAAEAQGVEADESMTKTEILEALSGAE